MTQSAVMYALITASVSPLEQETFYPTRYWESSRRGYFAASRTNSEFCNFQDLVFLEINRSNDGCRKAKCAHNVHVSIATVKTFNHIQLDINRNTFTNFLMLCCLRTLPVKHEEIIRERA
ncbi:hypothetical protein M514_08375 [Trichuris suis]|uniref:Uncharacterized protein n=1 Tax=Trichuris suis TaxID=68888 RepID=A0A085M0H3_9BILA|nr:hypothetical protein M513_08375 [Trichuris suis]KFD63176.1 hypothetical protein M514_08375 [Trichuris suis]